MRLEKYHDNPILTPHPENDWENLAVCNPGVWYEDGVFYMLYRVAGNHPRHPVYLGLAISKNGFDFQRVDDQLDSRRAGYQNNNIPEGLFSPIPMVS